MEEVQKHLYVLIHAGGGGTRLWPQSREASPKQFIKLFKGKSLFQMTLERARQMVPVSHILVTTSAKYVTEIKKEARGLPAENIISEPIRRDSAMAYGLGALYVYKRDPDSVVINLASDHLVSPLDTYVRQILFTASLAYRYNKVVVVGVKPDFPHTGLGHIKAVKRYPSEKDPQVLLGEKFVEKPPLPLAKRYTESGDYFWNLNMFAWRTKLILDLLKKYSPKTCAMFPKMLDAIGTTRENEVLQMVFQMAPSISVEYAVVNELRNFILYSASFNWSDVGDWNIVWQHLSKDKLGNVIEGPRGRGEYIGINSKNNLLFLDKKIVATVGLEDMLIIDTPDALLICPKDEAQGVKQVVQALKDNNLTEYL